MSKHAASAFVVDNFASWAALQAWVTSQGGNSAIPSGFTCTVPGIAQLAWDGNNWLYAGGPLKYSPVTGAAALTDITLTGSVKGRDIIVGAWDITTPAALSELPAITADGKIQFPTVTTATKTVMVVWSKLG